MRVALVLAAASGGAANKHAHALALARGLVAAGDTVEVCGPASLGDAVAEAGAELSVVEIPVSAGPRDIAAITALRRVLRGGGADVVHAHGLRAGFVAELARPGDVPLVVSWVDPLAEHGVRFATDRALARIVAGAADATLCATGSLVEAANRFGARQVELSPMVVTPLPAPARSRDEVRAEFGLGPDAPLLLAVGRLDPEHHYDVLVEAAARWRALRPAPVVLVVGTGPTYRHLVGQIVVARAPVHLIGDRADVPDLLRAADLAVVTGTALDPVRAALAAGVAVVGPDTAAVAELTGAAAALVAVGDVDALDVAVRGLLDDPDARAARSAAGATLAAGWPDAARVVAAVRAAYERVRSVTAEPSAARDAPT